MAFKIQIETRWADGHSRIIDVEAELGLIMAERMVQESHRERVRLGRSVSVTLIEPRRLEAPEQRSWGKCMLFDLSFEVLRAHMGPKGKKKMMILRII